MTFAFYDASNNQKLTANFSWLPDLDSFITLLASNSNKSKPPPSGSNGTIHHYISNNGKHPTVTSSAGESSNNIFSLNGVEFGAEALQMLNSDLKQHFYARIKKVRDLNLSS